MLFQINGLQIQNLQKAKDKLVTVDIVANHLTEDLDGETVLKEAFNKETIKQFLDIGVIEYWHESRNPLLSKEEKNKALIGKPIAFRWENGKPVVTATLTRDHPIVKDMMPHLEANNPVYAASIGGSKMVLEVQDGHGVVHNVIPKIKWDHLALAPCNSVVNREPGINVRMLQKAQELMVEFDDINSFSSSGPQYFSREQELRKALLAPQSTGEMYSTPGGVITRQDLEKSDIIDLSFNEDEAMQLLDTVIRIKNDEIPLTKEGYFDFFKLQNSEFADKSYRLFNKFFN
jgi:hypothetical protein